jgi:hypothetical protein
VARAHGAVLRDVPDAKATSVLSLMRQRPLLIFAFSVLLLQLANAAMLPLMAGVVTTRSSQWAPVLIAACIIVSQAIVALMSSSVEAWRKNGGGGRCCFWGLPRWLFAVCHCARSLCAGRGPVVRRLVFGVMVPLIVADIAFGSGHFNLAQGIVGTATGIGA